MKRSEWQSTRLFVLAAQQGRCATPGCSAPGRDVIMRGAGFCAFCRSCRLKNDGHERALKARHTITVKRNTRLGQQEIFS